MFSNLLRFYKHLSFNSRINFKPLILVEQRNKAFCPITREIFEENASFSNFQFEILAFLFGLCSQICCVIKSIYCLHPLSISNL